MTSSDHDRRAAATPARGVARRAGLRYSTGEGRGLTRLRAGKGFRYVDASGKSVTQRGTLERIRGLGIPPAWEKVWICPDPQGHLQATGRDARGRKQYRYHAEWNTARDATKFDRLPAFAAALPQIRRQVARDLRRPGLGREKVLAVVVRLLESTLIRIGNEEYVRQNRSFGLTTLRDRHVSFRRGTLHFHFLGKSGKTHDVDLHDPQLARLVKRLQDLPGQELFQYVADDGSRQSIDSSDINDYLRAAAGEEFSAKDFRTWWGTTLTAVALGDVARETGSRPTKRALQDVIVRVAASLGNTPTICRKSYVHPAVINGYLAGRTVQCPSRAGAPDAARPGAAGRRLTREEAAVAAYLRRESRRRTPSLSEALQRSLRRKTRRSPVASGRRRVKSQDGA